MGCHDIVMFALETVTWIFVTEVHLMHTYYALVSHSKCVTVRYREELSRK